MPNLTSGSAYLPAELHLAYSVADGDYIYVLYQNMTTSTGTGGIAGEAGLAIFEASGSDDYDYVSHIALYKGGSASGIVPIPLGIVIQDDLAVIGAAKGTIYFVDISDKDDPELINELVIIDIDDDYYSSLSDAYPLAMKDDVLFVVTSEGVMGEGAETTIHAYDISNPDDTDEDDDLDSYTIDDFDIHTMVIDSGYLYVAGNEANDEPSILVFDISDPEHLSLEKTFTDLDGDDYSHVSLAVNGDYLFATVGLDEDSSDYEDHGFKFKIINISNPENPALVYSSGRLEGVPLPDQKNIACSGNHVFLLTTIGDYGAWISGATWWLNAGSFESKVHVFDVTDPPNADQVETSSKYDGAGRGLYVVATDRLCLHTDTELIIFDISDPTDLSLEGTVNIYSIMDGKLDDSYQYYYGMASTPSYGYYGSPYIYNNGYRNAAFSGYNTYPLPYTNYFNYPSYPVNASYRYGNYMGGIYPGGYGYNRGYYNYGPGYGPSFNVGYPNYGTGNLRPYGGFYNYPSGYGYQRPYGIW
ncbi:MAG: LVIVD repeat-containing protein [bacterium]